MLEDDISDLLPVAAAIVELDRYEGDVTDKRQWQANKNQYDALVEQFNKQRDELIDALLAGGAGRDAAVQAFEAAIAAMRQRADPAWHAAIDYTNDKVLPELTKQAGRSPNLRRALKLAPWVAGAIAVVAYFAIRLFGGVAITDEIDTRAGIQQRADAVHKVFRYDDWMDTRVRRGGIFKALLFWPIEPTDAEINGAAEFAGLVIEGQKHADGCGAVSGYGSGLTDEQLKMIGEVADYVRRENVAWQDPPVLTVVKGLENASRC